MNSQSKSFYETLPVAPSLAAAFEGDYFTELPDDWSVIVTDLEDSTAAIEQGRYSDVNFLGVATVVAIQNVVQSYEIPHVFGGDGAYCFVLTADEPRVLQELARLQVLAERNYELTLRVAAFSMASLKARRYPVQLARLKSCAGRTVGLCRGAGIEFAELALKTMERHALPSDTSLIEPNLKGLTCRWQPIPSSRGTIVSVIIQSREQAPIGIYHSVVTTLEEIFQGDLDLGNPVNSSHMVYKSMVQNLRDEWRIHQKKLSKDCIGRMLEVVMAGFIFGHGVGEAKVGAREYLDSLKFHCDYQKFDGALRLVLDCSAAEINVLVSVLDGLYHRGEIFYGIHQSAHALMTCYVQGLKAGRHFHYIDGGNGGYGLAAKGMKRQISYHSTTECEEALATGSAVTVGNTEEVSKLFS